MSNTKTNPICDHQTDFSRLQKTPSFITLTLNAKEVSSIITNNTTDLKISHQTNNGNACDKDIDKRKELKEIWDRTCRKWGFIVERKLTYSSTDHNIYFDGGADAHNDVTNSTIITSSSSSNRFRIVDDQVFEKTKDELIISKVLSDGLGTQLMEGDIIDSVYGMQEPTLSLLFGIMRDSYSFQMTIKRMESEIERCYRLGGVKDFNIFHSQENYQIHRKAEEVIITTKHQDMSDANHKIDMNIGDSSRSHENVRNALHLDENVFNDEQNHLIQVILDETNQDVNLESVNGAKRDLSRGSALNRDPVDLIKASTSPSLIKTPQMKKSENMPLFNPYTKRAFSPVVLSNAHENYNNIGASEETHSLTNMATPLPLYALNQTIDKNKDMKSVYFPRIIHESPIKDSVVTLTSKHSTEERVIDSFSESEMDSEILREEEELKESERLLHNIIQGSLSNSDKAKAQQPSSVSEHDEQIREGSDSEIHQSISFADKNNVQESEKGQHRKRKNTEQSSDDLRFSTSGESKELISSERNSSDALSDNKEITSFSNRTVRPSPLTLSRASPLTVFRQASVTTVASKSSKNAQSNTKLKRLWPNSSVFLKRILRWSPPSISKIHGLVRFRGPPRSASNKLPIIPTQFKDASEMIKLMTPHIIEEGVLSVEQEFLSNSDGNGIWTREVYTLKLRSCLPVEPRLASTSSTTRIYELAFSVEEMQKGPPPSNLGEIFVIHCPYWTQQTCVGIIGSNDIHSTFLADQKLVNDENDLFKLWICACSDQNEDNSGWLKEENMPKKEADGSVRAEIMYASVIGTSTDMMRQYEGLKSLACIKPNLKRIAYGTYEGDEFNNRGILDLETSTPLVKPVSIVAKVWDHLVENTNKYQLFAIESIMSGRLKDGIALLQGPPGSGKTKVITHLVSALLNGSSTKSSGTRVQIGGAFQCDENPILNSSISKRILVCAPSNQAVDELAWRIHRNSIGPNGKIGGFNIIRFGILPGEERHDGRGRRADQRSSSFHSNERDKFLSDINLDNLVRDIASGREVNDFAYQTDVRDETVSTNLYGQRKSRFINYTVERQKILDQCHVVCCTISGAGSKAFIEAVSRDAFAHSEFDAIIIDEACQASDYTTLIPFKYNPNLVVLVGDPKQLPVMTLSKTKNCNADRSMFEQLYQSGWPIHLLRIQYRMHPEIVKFPSQTFYSNNLITSEHILADPWVSWHEHRAFPPYLLWNFHGSSMHRSTRGGLSNRGEAAFVVELILAFSFLNPHIRNLDIGIISFYNEQVSEIKNRVKSSNLDKWMFSNKISLQISTVDGFQGCEKDIIILSCVRSKWINDKKPKDVGFLKDFRRVNVALTRAKHSLWIVADCKTLSQDALWCTLIENAFERGLIAQHNSLSGMVRNPSREKESYSRNKKIWPTK